MIKTICNVEFNDEEDKKMNNKGNKGKQNYLTHSLTGNTSGSNNTQTVVNILNRTTVNQSKQSPKSNGNQSKKVGD